MVVSVYTAGGARADRARGNGTMQRLELDCEELLNWWEPKSDISYIFRFNWRSLQQLREAVTLFLSARLHNVSQRARKAVSETGCNRLKAMIASNPETPADMLEFLTHVSPVDVLVRVAENQNACSQTLTRLAMHEDFEVRMAVAENPNCPSICLEMLIDDRCADVRFRLAENPNAPISVLYKALKDENPYVSHRARKTLARILTNTITLSAQMMTHESEMNKEILDDKRFAEHLMAELNETLGFHPNGEQVDARPPINKPGSSSGINPALPA